MVEELERYVLAAVRLCAKRPCTRGKIHAALFVLAQEFEELARMYRPYVWKVEVDAALRRLVEDGYLEERLEALKEIDGVRLPSRVHTYRLTKAGRIIAEDALKEIDSRIRERMKELLRMGTWSLIGYAYVRHPGQAVFTRLDVY